MEAKTKQAVREDVVREFPPVGKYRIRVVQTKTTCVLDVREYVASETFEGFTRRGVRLDRVQTEALLETLKQLLESGALPKA